MSSSRASGENAMRPHRRARASSARLRQACAARLARTCRGWLRVTILVILSLSSPLSAQAPPPTERVTFQQAITRAIERNPSSARAAAGILRADALLREARAATLLQVNGDVTTTTLNRGVEFAGLTVTPRNSLLASLDVHMPVLAAAQWARRAQ